MPYIDPNLVKKNLRKILENKDIRALDLARAMPNTSLTNVYNWLARGLMSESKIRAIANVLRTSMYALTSCADYEEDNWAMSVTDNIVLINKQTDYIKFIALIAANTDHVFRDQEIAGIVRLLKRLGNDDHNLHLINALVISFVCN